MIFNSKKYSEETEKNRIASSSDPSTFNMISLGLLATFAPSRWILRLRKLSVDNFATINPILQKQCPIIYIHGFRGGAYTTQVMVDEVCKLKHDSHYLRVIMDLSGKVTFEGEWTSDKHPVIQLVFRQRIIGKKGINYYLSRLLPLLKSQFHFDNYYAVAHSLGAPAIIDTQMRYAKNAKFPQLKKVALIAGPFNGVTYLGDIPNVNIMGEKGYPLAMNLTYLHFLHQRKRFSSHIQVLNIYGNILDETNTDKFISVVSAKSIRYILAPQLDYYQEVEVRGAMAEHSQMHDEPFVIDIINHFLGLK